MKNQIMAVLVSLALILVVGRAPIMSQESAEPTTVPQEDPGWPREYSGEGERVLLYQPQLEDWVDYQRLEARAAVKIERQGDEKPALGALRMQAETRTDTENRSVYVYNLEIIHVHFPGLAPEKAEPASATVKKLLPKGPLTVSLDRVVAGLERTRKTTHGVEVSLKPPPIFFSTKPAILVMIDGEPVGIDIEGTDLQYVVNTNWNLFRRPTTSRYYLLNEDMWLTAEGVVGPWTATSSLPESFSKLPEHDNWKEARENLPPRDVKSEEAPVVFVSREPAELILVAGSPKLEAIDGTQLGYVANTESNVFFHDGDKKFYFLTSGRWFRATATDGPWEAATASLPDDFARIPEDHVKGLVLASVPGTEQAEEAVLLASIPQTVTLNRADATASVAYLGDPQFEPVEGTSMEYAANTKSDVIHVGDRYYLCEQGVWFVSLSPEGPWEITDSVPKEIYTIPPESPKHTVTYVEVYNSTPTSVTVGYTAGYWGMYVAYGAVLWGTGYHYPPYWGWGHYPYPVYWGYPYYSYGMGSYYNPHTGMYGRSAFGYGPYGGYGRAAAYNPRTGAYARGGAAWGPYGSAWGATAYNPRTGTAARGGAVYDYWNDAYAAGYRARDGYSRWGEAIVGEGDDWVHGKYRGNERGTVFRGETSEGGQAVGFRGDRHQGFVARDEDDDVFVGNDGNVYKRDDDGDWYRGDDGDWDKIPKEQVENARQDLATKAEERRANLAEGGEQRRAEVQEQRKSGERTPLSERASAGAREGSSLGQLAREKGAATDRQQQIQGRARERDSVSARDLTRSGSVRDMQSSDVMRGLERDSRSRTRGNQRTQQTRDWRRSYPSGGYSRSSGRRGGGGFRRGGFRRR